MDFSQKLEKARGIPEVFSLVKEVVQEVLGARRAGLMLGFAEMGMSPRGFIGAFYPIHSNLIVINKTSARVVEETKPRILKAYYFHLLLHEYIHSLGVFNETEARRKTFFVSSKAFGANHVVTQLSLDSSKFLPQILYPIPGSVEDFSIELVPGFDKDSNYIS